MKQLTLKIILYIALILIVLEILVRVFHLSKDTPTRYLDEQKVEKWSPNQNGFSVTGNRRQNFSEFHINDFGFNSYQEFTPLKDKIEVAIIGDSYIEGFQQNYYNSIGKKIEKEIANIQVYEYGYAGYDFADQLHLTYAYKAQFDLIDHIILSIKFSNDLTRKEYGVVTRRLALESPINKLLKKSKLLVYCKSIGILDPPQELTYRLLNFLKKQKTPKKIDQKSNRKINLEKMYLENFKKLTQKYGFDKERYTLLLDSRITPSIFLSFLKDNDIKFIDFAADFESTDQPTTLIYDRHWNDFGRELIAKNISRYLKEEVLK